MVGGPTETDFFLVLPGVYKFYIYFSSPPPYVAFFFLFFKSIMMRTAHLGPIYYFTQYIYIYSFGRTVLARCGRPISIVHTYKQAQQNRGPNSDPISFDRKKRLVSSKPVPLLSGFTRFCSQSKYLYPICLPTCLAIWAPTHLSPCYWNASETKVRCHRQLFGPHYFTLVFGPLFHLLAVFSFLFELPANQASTLESQPIILPRLQVIAPVSMASSCLHRFHHRITVFVSSKSS